MRKGYGRCDRRAQCGAKRSTETKCSLEKPGLSEGMERERSERTMTE